LTPLAEPPIKANLWPDLDETRLTRRIALLKDPTQDRIALGNAQRAGETQTDYRQRIALLQAEAVERRRHELGEQCAPHKTPADRIIIWERLHQLPLPGSPGHRLIRIIAADTGLSVNEVHAEQRARSDQRKHATG
jgi:hypothetical protein